MLAQKNDFALMTNKAWKKLIVRFYWLMLYAGDCLSGAKYRAGAKFGQNNRKQR